MFTRAIALLLVLFAVVPKSAAQTLFLGALEDVPGVYVGEANVRRVRLAFRKEGADWVAFNGCPDQDCLKTAPSELPRSVIWNIGFDGRVLGQVTGRTPDEFGSYAHVGLQDITSGGPVPTIGPRSAEFGGFTFAEVHRPLIANSQPYLTDPEAWKTSQLSPQQARLFRSQFRRQFPRLCRTNKAEAELLPFPYRDADIKVTKTYASNKGWQIVRLHLTGAIDCNDLEAGFEIDDPWFVLDPQGMVRYLGSGIWLVDAGDYDNDGKSELFFSIFRYNRGGYELLSEDFRKHVTSEFSYH